MSYFHKFVEFSEARFTKNYLPLLQQIADWLKKIGLVGTLGADKYLFRKCIVLSYITPTKRIREQRVSAHLLFFIF